jgi:hypothetical protein
MKTNNNEAPNKQGSIEKMKMKRVTSRLTTDSTSDTDERQNFQMPADMLQAAGPKPRH